MDELPEIEMPGVFGPLTIEGLDAILEKEIDWYRENTDKLDDEYVRGFRAGLQRGRTLINSLPELIDEIDSLEVTK